MQHLPLGLRRLQPSQPAPRALTERYNDFDTAPLHRALNACPCSSCGNWPTILHRLFSCRRTSSHYAYLVVYQYPCRSGVISSRHASCAKSLNWGVCARYAAIACSMAVTGKLKVSVSPRSNCPKSNGRDGINFIDLVASHDMNDDGYYRVRPSGHVRGDSCWGRRRRRYAL